MKRSFTLVICSLFGCLLANSTPTFSPLSPAGAEEIRSNLYVNPGTSAPVLLDGSLTQYSSSYSNDLNGMDARKMSNFSENLGMIRGTTVLVIERRETISLTDTIFYKMWQMQQRSYQLEFITSNMNHPGMEGFLEDNYLKTSAPINLNGTTTANFSVTGDLASGNVFRFRIVFKTAVSGPLPLTFTSINAYRQNREIRIDWKTENESDMKNYAIEKSADGIQFIKATDLAANNFALNNYSWSDKFPANGYNYYRIQSTGKGGEVKKSEVLKVLNDKETSRINVYPNPVTDNTIHLQIANMAAGLYEIRLLNNFGQPVLQQKVQHAGGNFIQSIRQNHAIVKGVYQLEIITPAGTKLSEKVVY